MNLLHLFVLSVFVATNGADDTENEFLSTNESVQMETYIEEDRPWCPPAKDIFPCTCDGPQTFLLLTCDRIENAYTITRVVRSIHSVRDFGKFSLTNSRLSNLEINLLGFLRFEYLFAKKNTVRNVESVFFESSRDSLKRIEFVHNDIEKFPFKELGTFPKLEYIDLRYNSLKKIPDEAFGRHINSKLKEIDLSSNKINHIGSNAFKYLTNLELIDLRNNRLSVLNNFAFSGLQANAQLKLNLANNKLMFVSLGAFQNQIFKVLNLSNNRLTKLSEDVFKGTLKGMAERQSGNIYVDNNQFVCACKDVEWIVRLPSFYRSRIIDMQCRDHDDKNIQDLSFNEIGCPTKG